MLETDRIIRQTLQQSPTNQQNSNLITHHAPLLLTCFLPIHPLYIFSSPSSPMALKPEDKKIMSSSMDSSQRKSSNNHSSSLFTINTMRSQKPDPVSSIIKKLKPQYYQKPISDPTHTQTLFLTKSSSLSSTTNSSLHRHQQPQSRKITEKLEKPKKEKTHKSKKGSPEEKLVIEEDEEPRRSSVSSIITVGRRKSFCDSKIELKEFLASATARIVAVDMPPFMQIHAVSCARKTQDSLEKHSPRILASTLKKEFDGVYGPAWHCIVGTSFGSFVTHSVGGFLYFSIDNKLYFLLFKTTVQKAD